MASSVTPHQRGLPQSYRPEPVGYLFRGKRKGAQIGFQHALNQKIALRILRKFLVHAWPCGLMLEVSRPLVGAGLNAVSGAHQRCKSLPMPDPFVHDCPAKGVLAKDNLGIDAFVAEKALGAPQRAQTSGEPM